MAGRELASLHGSVIGTVVVDSDQDQNHVQTVWMPAQHLGQFIHRRAPRKVGSRPDPAGAKPARPQVSTL